MGSVLTINDEQGNQDDAVYDNTQLDCYDQVLIDRKAIDLELKGKEQFAKRQIPEYYRRPVKRMTRELPQPDSISEFVLGFTINL